MLIALYLLKKNVSHQNIYSNLYLFYLFDGVLSRIKLPTSIGSSKKQESSRKTYFCFIDYAKAFDYVDYNKLWKIFKEMGIPDHLTCLLRNLYEVRKQQLELDMDNRLVPNCERSMSRLYIVTLLI